MTRLALVGLLGGLAAIARAAPSSPESLEKRALCFDSAKNPSCWDETHTLTTDYYQEWPVTGHTQSFNFVIEEIDHPGPDGVPRKVVAINKQIPGPTITADWGDTVAVTVTNMLPHNGSSIHFHGIRQYLSNPQDGTNSITQCPLKFNETRVYTWNATQYGTSWYHSHFGVQAWNGVFGGIQIRGPASHAYDKDLGVVLLSDWSHKSAEYNFNESTFTGGTTLDNGLINGKNVWVDPSTNVTSGERFELAFTPGLEHRIRLVNTAADTFYQVSIDNHTMTVIAADLVPIQPYPTDFIGLAHGQRYDVIIKANNTGGSFWLRAVPAGECSAPNNQQLNIRAVVRYDNSPTATPATPDIASPTQCVDVDRANLAPVVLATPGPQTPDGTHDISWVYNFTTFLEWDLNDTSFYNDWRYPSLQQVIKGNLSSTKEQHVITMDQANQWVYLIIRSPGDSAHPIHLHGHDFFILGQNTTEFDPSQLNVTAAPRRDVATLPIGGWLAIAIKADNPGVWLLHCHIAWHVSQGFALQLWEQTDQVAKLFGKEGPDLDQRCAAWAKFQEDEKLDQKGLHESGV